MLCDIVANDVSNKGASLTSLKLLHLGSNTSRSDLSHKI